MDGGQLGAPHVGVVLDGGPHRVLQQLRQDVVQRHLYVGEVGPYVARDLNLGTVTILVLCQLPDKVDPSLTNVPQPHAQVNQPNVAGLTLLKLEMTICQD